MILATENRALSSLQGVTLGKQSAVLSWKVYLKLLLNKGDNLIDYLREKCIFYVVPMINPDGVFWGNNRTSLAGVDLNRRWTEPDMVMQPEVFYLKSFIETLSSERIAIFVDLHGHSK